MIRNVVFDIGQVLKGWHPSLTSVFEEEIAHRVEYAIWGTGYWEQMDLGVIPDEELFRRMLAAAPECEEQITYIWNHLELVSEKYEYAIPWVETLKAAGFRVYFLSNYSRQLKDTVPQTIGFLPLMDGGVFSHEVKLLKPDPAIYRALCDKYELVPEECLFIDDRQENVDAAIAFGMQSVRFDGYGQSYGKIMKILGLM